MPGSWNWSEIIQSFEKGIEAAKKGMKFDLPTSAFESLLKKS